MHLDVIIILLLLIVIALLVRINEKLPGRDLAKEAMERYYKERENSEERKTRQEV